MGKMQDKMPIAVDKYVQGMYIDNTPKYSWYQAMQDAGYTQSYSHDRCADVWKRAKPLIDKRVNEIKTYWEYSLEWIDQQFRDLYAECRTKSDRVNASRCLEGLTKRKAGFTDVLQNNKDDSRDLIDPELQARLDIVARDYKERKAKTG